MKTIFNDYIKIVMYVIFGIILIMSSYIIILNIQHFKSLSDSIVVSEADNDYLKFKENVNLIEDYLNKAEFDEKISSSLSSVLLKMKNKGVFRLIPKTNLTSKDLYELNDYFMEELVNNGWVSNLKEYDFSYKYQDTIMLLVNNSNYINDILTKNSLILYDGSLDNKIEDNYHFILSNYMEYSKVILNICSELGGIDG